MVDEVLPRRRLLLLHGGVGVADDVERRAARDARLEGSLHRDGRRVAHVARRVLVVGVHALVLPPRVPPGHAPVSNPGPRQRTRFLQKQARQTPVNKQQCNMSS
ncbi:hypothetical protein C0J52_11476 [Blattella germanica]|nr:hypothetical protein C0J52_11476 [Blattella germanica]